MVKRLLLYIAVCGIGWTPAYASRDIDELFQKALVKESIQRDLDGAIRLYQRVVDVSGESPELAAEAGFRIGLCFEKLGKPESAESFYKQVLSLRSGVPADIARQARASLKRLEAERRAAVVRSSVPAPGVWSHPFFASRFALHAGPGVFAGPGAKPLSLITMGVRYRLSASTRTAVAIEIQGTVPFSDNEIADQSADYQATTDRAVLRLRYAGSIGFVGELWHGHQRTLIPEIGGGLAFNVSRARCTSASTVDVSEIQKSPYLQAGLHVRPDALCSWLLQARYVPAPYAKTYMVDSHSQTFAFPSSQWAVQAFVQVKIGRRQWVLRPKA